MKMVYIGYSFILLAILSLIEAFGLKLFNLGDVYPTCLAIAGVLFLIADYLNFKNNMLIYLRKSESRLEVIVEHFEKEGVNLSEFKKPNKEINVSFLEKHNDSLIAIIYIMAFFSMIVLPNLDIVIQLFQNDRVTESINNFSVFLGIGIAIYLYENKYEFSKDEQEINDVADKLFLNIYKIKQTKSEEE